MARIKFFLIVCTLFIFQSGAYAQVGVSGTVTVVPAIPTCTDLQLLKSIPCSDKELFFHQGQAIVQSAFNQGDYKLLDDTYKSWCTGKDRFPDGRWKLSQYGSGLEVNFKAWNNWEKDLLKIQKWKEAFPGSESAQFTEGVYWYSYAWRARGSGYAKSVSPEGWQLFRDRLQKSKSVFSEILKNEHACPAAYARMLDTMLSLGEAEDDLRSVYETGVKNYPQYHNIYFAMARYYDPKWHGDIDLYERFAMQAVEKTKSFEGYGMYARLYWLVDTSDNIPFKEGASHPPYWDKLNQGYEDLVKYYPSSIHNLGKYAGVACRTSDSKLYLQLRKKIDGYQNGADFYDSVDVCDLRHGWKK